MKLPHYTFNREYRAKIGRNNAISTGTVIAFLKEIVRNQKLTIDEYLGQMGQEPFFLVAATGLGKTVAVPVHVLIRQLQRCEQYNVATPRVWIVEPRIPIAQDQMAFMNSLWRDFLAQGRSKRRYFPLFGTINSVSTEHRDAPIQFVTTGIFELYAKQGKFDSVCDRVVIDEAHVTVEQNPGVEMAIALTRKAGVTVDYMSATVDVSTIEQTLGVSTIIRADKTRNDIWKCNLYGSLADSLVDLVKNTLTQPDTKSRYYPNSTEYHRAQEVIRDVLESDRAHGLLVVVNSFQGDGSDITKLSRLLREAYPSLPVLALASAVVRDPRKGDEFKRRLQEIEERHQNYVIMATSVVEMGITFGTLDYVVTMDSGYEQRTIGDKLVPVVTPLGVNSLLQRMGRVGRKRAGIAYISCEEEASYSQLDSVELNEGALEYEPIRLPLVTAPLTSLAFYAAEQGRLDVEAWLQEMNFPSGIHTDAERMSSLCNEIEWLKQLGIIDDTGLTQLGHRMKHWDGRAELSYAVKLQQRLNEGADVFELLAWVALTAFSNMSIVTFRQKNGYFVDRTGEHTAVTYDMRAWYDDWRHEDLHKLNLLGLLSAVAPMLFWGEQQRGEIVRMNDLRRMCAAIGLDAGKCIKLAVSLRETFKLFSQINTDSPQFRSVFGDIGKKRPILDGIRWVTVCERIDVASMNRQLCRLHGRELIKIEHKGDGEWLWSTFDAEPPKSGFFTWDDTPLPGGYLFSARLAPSLEKKNGAVTWRPVSLGTL